MNKNIIIKKEKPICQLDGLPGVKRRKVDAYSINNTSDIESTISNWDMRVLLPEIMEL